jgi:hypothetical protein
MSEAQPKARATSRVGTSRSTAARTRSAPDPGAKAAVVLFSGGNPQIAKADGDAPVQAYLAAMPGWKSRLGKRLDALIVRTVLGVRKAVTWNSPMYGVEGRGWFLGLHTYTRYLKVAFFRGASLQPVPPGASKNKDARYLDIHEGDVLDEERFASWVKRAATLPGWVPYEPVGLIAPEYGFKGGIISLSPPANPISWSHVPKDGSTVHACRE